MEDVFRVTLDRRAGYHWSAKQRVNEFIDPTKGRLRAFNVSACSGSFRIARAKNGSLRVRAPKGARYELHWTRNDRSRWIENQHGECERVMVRGT